MVSGVTRSPAVSQVPVPAQDHGEYGAPLPPPLLQDGDLHPRDHAKGNCARNGLHCAPRGPMTSAPVHDTVWLRAVPGWRALGRTAAGVQSWHSTAFPPHAPPLLCLSSAALVEPEAWRPCKRPDHSRGSMEGQLPAASHAMIEKSSVRSRGGKVRVATRLATPCHQLPVLSLSSP